MFFTDFIRKQLDQKFNDIGKAITLLADRIEMQNEVINRQSEFITLLVQINDNLAVESFRKLRNGEEVVTAKQIRETMFNAKSKRNG